MNASITINLAGGTATSNNVFVELANSAVAPGSSDGVVVAMASALTNVSVFSAEITVATASGAQFSGSIAIPISWTSSETPTVTLNNLLNPTGSPATVTWPTENGPEVQILSPGDPLVLSGIVSS